MYVNGADDFGRRKQHADGKVTYDTKIELAEKVLDNEGERPALLRSSWTGADVQVIRAVAEHLGT